MTLTIATSKAPKISSFKKIGARLGGYDTSPWNWILLSIRPRQVTDRTPINIAPVIFLDAKTAIKRKPAADKKVSICKKLPKLTNVASLAMIIPPLFRPIKPINKPTPEPIAILRFKGMLSSIHFRKGVTLIITNNIPAKKTAPKATSHE